ncbi:glycosyltransferase [Clostridium sp. UBA4395]|uniref:glycosyltransferase family 4 protein n=1 Tax=Clostridium sp. UBA4395 TaxID=1946360 RepID=UPI003216FF37
MKKVALISFSNNFDMQQSLYNLYYDLKKCNLEVITLGSNNLKVSIDKSNDNKLFNVPIRPGIELKTFNFREIFRIVNMLSKVDLIYFFSSHTWNILIIKLLMNKIKIIHTIHDAFPHEGEKQTKNVVMYNRYICNNVKYIVLHNKKYIESFKKHYKFKGEIIYSPLWRTWSDFKKKNECKNNVLFLGRVNPYKGIGYIKILAEKMPEIEFNIVGKFSNEVINLKSELINVKNVNIIDKYVSENEMLDVIDKNDIIILPYKSATQSGVVIDAYRNSTPVVAFKVGAIEEQVKNNITGYLVNAGNINDFSKCIYKYFNLKDTERYDMQLNCWKFGRNNCSTSLIVNAIIKLIE